MSYCIYMGLQCLGLHKAQTITQFTMSPGRRPLSKVLLNTDRMSRGRTRKSTLPPSTAHGAVGRPGLKLSDFEFGKLLGKGKLGKAYCVRHRKSGFICAIKAMSKKELVELRLEKNFCREIEVQRHLVHPNIARLYSFFFDDTNVYLVLEYAPYGELYQQLKAHRRFDDVTASSYTYQVASALQYLHAKGVIHRDIKPENILIAADRSLKLSDFGWSVKSRASDHRLTICGTLDYLPPEMVESNEHDHSVDVWLLGVLCYELLVGKPPFEEVDKNATYKRIARVDLHIPSFVEADAADLIHRLLQKDPHKRMPLADVEHHPWIVKYRPLWPKRDTSA